MAMLDYGVIAKINGKIVTTDIFTPIFGMINHLKLREELRDF